MSHRQLLCHGGGTELHWHKLCGRIIHSVSAIGACTLACTAGVYTTCTHLLSAKLGVIALFAHNDHHPPSDAVVDYGDYEPR